MATVVEAKKAKNAAAKASSRLVNRPKPASGKPSTVLPRGPSVCADCVIFAASVV